MGRYAGLTTAENKHTYLYLEPQDNRIIVCVITKLHCTLLSPLLHFVLVAVWTAGREKKKKKRLFVQWQKPTRKRAEVLKKKSKCRFPLFDQQLRLFNTQQTACRNYIITFWGIKVVKTCNFSTNTSAKTFQVSRNSETHASNFHSCNPCSHSPSWVILGDSVRASNVSNCRNYVTRYKTNAHNVF